MSFGTIFLIGGLVALFLSIVSMPVLRFLERRFMGANQEQVQN